LPVEDAMERLGAARIFYPIRGNILHVGLVKCVPVFKRFLPKNKDWRMAKV
jgi:hypothetical protein